MSFGTPVVFLSCLASGQAGDPCGQPVLAAPLYEQDNPRAVVLGDVDGDGDIDVVGSSVLLNAGNGALLESGFEVPAFVGSSASFRLVLGHLDAGGTLDLVIVGNGVVGAAAGAGDGTFAPFVELPVYDDPQDVATGDLDGDGDQDLVVTQRGTDRLAVLRNDGAGVFSFDATYPTGDWPRSVIVVDVDDDGDLDCACVNYLGHTVSVLLNQGTGVFDATDDHPSGPWPRDLRAGDLDGDGRPELVVASSFPGGVGVFANQGGGSFAPVVVYATFLAHYRIELADVDHDDDLDVVAGGGSSVVSILLNQGAGSLHLWRSFPAWSFRDFAIGDLDGDGNLDATVVRFHRDDMIQLFGTDDGAFGSRRHDVDSLLVGVAADDLDGDGATDVVAVSMLGETLTVLAGDAEGSLRFESVHAVGGLPSDVIVADVDADAWPDVVVVNGADGDISLLRNAGGTLLPQERTPVGAGPVSVTAGDFDGDRDVDLATANRFSGDLSVLLNDGDGEFAPAASYGAGLEPYAIVAGDFDGDDDLDLAVADLVGSEIQVHLNAGDGTYASVVCSDGVSSPWSLAAGDVDLDGDLDLAVASSAEDTVVILANTGAGAFETAATFVVEHPRAVALEDLDGDGAVDLAVAALLSGDSEELYVHLNAGDGRFGPCVPFDVGEDAWDLTFADLDDDGRSDLITADSGSGTVSVLRGRCSGAGPPCPADLDGDGAVAVLDLIEVLASWGEPGGPADLDGDGVVGIGDLVVLFLAWGTC